MKGATICIAVLVVFGGAGEASAAGRAPFDTPPAVPPSFDRPPFETPPVDRPPFGLGGGVPGNAGDSLAASSRGARSAWALGNITPVPEPGVLVMLFGGGLIVFTYAWQRRRGR